jgi:hypothetical protein
MLQLTYTGVDALEWREAPEPQLSSDGRETATAVDAADALLERGWTKLVIER